MREYETTFIVQPEISDEGVQALRERLDGLLEKGGARRLLYDDQGRRRLAYEIRKFQKGRFISLLYLDEGGVVADLERALRLDDSVLRFLTVQVTTEVKNIDERVAEAAELERLRAQKAAERAAREAEEAARAAEAAAAAEPPAPAPAPADGGDGDAASAPEDDDAADAPAESAGDDEADDQQTEARS